jgi:STE24 endopeptidase
MWLILGTALLSSVASAPAQTALTNRQLAQSQTQPHELKVTDYTLPPGKLAKARALYETSTELYLFSLVFGIAVLWVLLQLRVAPFFRDLAERVSKGRFVRTPIFVSLLMLLIAFILLPMDVYTHHISRQYGLSVQGWGSWMGDWLKGQTLSLIVTILAVFGLFWVIRKSPQRWWLYFWLLTLPFVVLVIFIAPVVLDPMFNTFVPLEQTQPQLVTAIQRVTNRAGLQIPVDRMFEMKASEKVTTYNAYVTGIGATKRVVVWDNTARDMTIPETLFVFVHEMGHYVLNHIYKGLAFYAALAFVGFWAGQKIVILILSHWGENWRLRGINDLAALPVFLLTLTLLSLVSQPFASAFSRHIEHQADIYGLEVTHGMILNSDEVGASAFQKLGEKSYDYPTPSRFLVFWSYDHPTIKERIRFSLNYDPWNTPSGPRYVK